MCDTCASLDWRFQALARKANAGCRCPRAATCIHLSATPAPCGRQGARLTSSIDRRAKVIPWSRLDRIEKTRFLIYLIGMGVLPLAGPGGCLVAENPGLVLVRALGSKY